MRRYRHNSDQLTIIAASFRHHHAKPPLAQPQRTTARSRIADLHPPKMLRGGRMACLVKLHCGGWPGLSDSKGPQHLIVELLHTGHVNTVRLQSVRTPATKTNSHINSAPCSPSCGTFGVYPIESRSNAARPAAIVCFVLNTHPRLTPLAKNTYLFLQDRLTVRFRRYLRPVKI